MEPLKTTDVERRFLSLELSVKQLQDQLAAQGLALSWLMATLCPDEARRFLSAQANELEKSQKFPEDVAQLDALREELVQWLVQWKDEKSNPRS